MQEGTSIAFAVKTFPDITLAITLAIAPEMTCKQLKLPPQ